MMTSFEEKLINLVRENESLYHSKSRANKNILKRDQTWTEISELLERPVDECKQRWKSLRDRYVREKKKQNQPSGSSLNQCEKWEYFSALQFLDDTLQHRDLPEQPPIFISVRQQARKRTQRNFKESSMQEFLGKLRKNFDERYAHTDDENDLFMKMLAKKMKGLPGNVKIKLQEKFLKDVNEEILKLN